MKTNSFKVIILSTIMCVSYVPTSADASEAIPAKVKSLWDKFFVANQKRKEGNGKLLLADFGKAIFEGRFNEASDNVEHDWAVGNFFFGKKLAQKSIVDDILRYQLSGMRQVCPNIFNNHVRGKVSFLPTKFTIKENAISFEIESESRTAFNIADIIIMKNSMGCNNLRYYAENAVAYLSGDYPIYELPKIVNARKTNISPIRRSCYAEWKGNEQRQQDLLCQCLDDKIKQNLSAPIVSAFERSWGDGGKAVEEYNVRQVFMNRVWFACDKYTDAIN